MLSFSNRASGENGIAWKSRFNQIWHLCFLTIPSKQFLIFIHGKYNNKNMKGSWTGWWNQWKQWWKKHQTNHNINQTAQSRLEFMGSLYWNVFEIKSFVFYLIVSKSLIICGAKGYQHLKWSTERDVSQINSI